MKRFFSIINLFLFFSFPAYKVIAQCTSGSTGNTAGTEYTLVWADEFSDDGAVCGENWFHQTQLPAGGNWYNNEQQHYTDELANSSVANGMLKITAIKEQYSAQGYTKSYTSARLNSKFAFTYGRVDARAKLPAGDGTWPAIWMLGQDIIEPGGYWSDNYGTAAWPAIGEIDIMEHWGNNPNVIHGSLHTTSSSGATVNTGTTTISNVSSEFHVYSMIWDEYKIQFLVDDVAYYTYQPANKTADNWPFDSPQYLLLNIAMGGIGGAIDPNFTSSSMEIDYVRVYQKEGSDPPPPDPTTPTVSAPVPTESSSDVISMFSDAYQDVTVDTWNTAWSLANLQEVNIDGDAVKKYTELNYGAAEVVANQLDITNMTHLHVDFWSPNSTRFGVKLVDFGANAVYQGSTNDDTEHELVFNNPAQGKWVSYDLPIADFTNLQNKQNIAQLIFYSTPSGTSTVYIDNVYFFDASDGLDLEVIEDQVSTEDLNCNNIKIHEGATLTIMSGHTLTVNGNMLGTGGLVINSGGSLITYDGKTISNVTVKRNTRYADGKYSFVGSPVEANASIIGSDLGSIVYWYDEEEPYGEDGLARWKDAFAMQLMPGKGYSQANQKEIRFIGVPNDGTVTVYGLSHTNADSRHDEHGWNLVSNPYPAAIGVDAFLGNTKNSSVTTGSIYLWDDHGSDTGRGDNGDYLTVNSLGTVNGPNGGVFKGYIGSMQGFFVKIASPTDNESIEFTESMRVSAENTDATFFRQAAKGVNVKLALSNASLGYYNELLVGLRNDATMGVDKTYDADKLIGNDRLQFYSYINANKYAIQGLPIENGVSTELGFNLDLDTELTFTVKEGGEGFYLTDRITGIVYDLSEVSTFTFQSSKGTEQNRFVLSYGRAAILSTEPVTGQPVYRFVDRNMNVTLPDGQITSYAVYDMTGRGLSYEMTNAVNQVQIPITSKGIRIIKLTTTSGTFTRKFLFE